MAMKAVRCLIIEDNVDFRRCLRAMLKQFVHINVVGEAGTLNEGRALITALDPDLIFLDVEIGLEIGFDLIRDPDTAPMVIVISACESYAIKAFELRALDYLVKPFGLDRLREAVSRLRLCCLGGIRSPRCRAVSAFLRADDAALIDDGKIRMMIAVKTMVLIEADGNYTRVFTEDDTYHMVRRSCDEWINMLPSELFTQLDRSLVVNMHHVVEWIPEKRGLHVIMGPARRKVAIGRAATKRFKNRLVHGVPV
jgi:two-component system LytT family response regulator